MHFSLLSAAFLAVFVSIHVHATPEMVNAIARLSDDGNFKNHPWIAPKATDVRGPCPGLNTLANHGFLPRNGMNLTISTVLQASLDAYNVDPQALLLAAKIGLTASPDLDQFSLKDIRLHNAIEHDASISRADFFTGDNFSFNSTIFQTLLASNPGSDFYNASSQGLVQKARLEHSRATNPTLINTRKEFAIRTRESALFLAVMGNVTSGEAPKNFVNVFFQEERLPIAEGWTRSPILISGKNLAPISAIITNFSDWSADAGVCASLTVILTGNKTVTF